MLVGAVDCYGCGSGVLDAQPLLSRRLPALQRGSCTAGTGRRQQRNTHTAAGGAPAAPNCCRAARLHVLRSRRRAVVRIKRAAGRPARRPPPAGLPLARQDREAEFVLRAQRTPAGVAARFPSGCSCSPPPCRLSMQHIITVELLAFGCCHVQTLRCHDDSLRFRADRAELI